MTPEAPENKNSIEKPEFDARLYPMARAVLEAYRRGEEDEAMEPLVLADASGNPKGRIKKGDSVIFYDIRGEREIELTRSLTDTGFTHFPVENLDLDFATMIRYDPALPVRVAFPPEEEISDTISEAVSRAGLRQVKICESEKEVHVSFFFNGKKTGLFPGEERMVIPSPREAGDYSGHPGLSAAEVSQAVIGAMDDGVFDFVMVNYANVDVVGHSEKRDAIIKAVETVDGELGRVVEEARLRGVTTVITADHGTVEKWYYPDGAIDTGHTDSPVPFILVPPKGSGTTGLFGGGGLTDVAPTILSLLGLPIPDAMTGNPLVGPAGKGSASKVLMIILDGWGVGRDPRIDLLRAARTPAMDRLMASHPATELAASGEAVGLPAGTVGNSEAGHLHLGAGRAILSDRSRIDKALKDGSFYRNQAFLECMRKAREKRSALHLMGIISFYSSHGSIKHLQALMDMAAEEGVPEVYVHGFLGRRGERPESGSVYVSEVERHALGLGLGRMVSCLGRFWSLDREGNWDRIEKTYDMLVRGEGRHVIPAD